MLALYIVIFIAVIFAVTYVFLVMPRVTDSADMELQSTDYAHRGLHSATVPENSVTAFTLARDAGYGIELDVRMSSDGKIFVFHDDNLLRMCATNKKLSEMTSAEVRSYRLKGSAERIPLLSEILELIDGRVPLLIEIKPDENAFLLCKRLCLMLDTYSGAFAIQSFDPRILGYFKKYRPRFARGLLVTKIRVEKGKADISLPKNPFTRFALTHMLTNVIARPDFISIYKKHIPEPAFFLATRVFKRKGFVWTVKTKQQYMICREKGLYSIFEGIRPQ